MVLTLGEVVRFYHNGPEAWQPVVIDGSNISDETLLGIRLVEGGYRVIEGVATV